jgi:hypothetical protein
LQKKAKETKGRIGIIFNPLNWFDAEQKTFKVKLNQLEGELKVKKDRIERIKKALFDIEQFIKKNSEDIERYKGFDRQQACIEVNKLSQKIVSLEEDLKRTSELKGNVDVELRPILDHIRNYDSKIATAEESLKKAQSIQRRLDQAENSYQRAMIHQECENSFGDSAPKKIIRQQEILIRQCERDLKKANQRALRIGEKAARDIRKIVVDGNNMCYEDSVFVGLQPLLTLTQELHLKYEIIVIFDSAIRSQLKANDKTIREQFHFDIKIHIVATEQLADETILDLASNNAFCYVLSNDRYGEYQEKEVVKANRLIRHEIVGGKIMIHDLNVSARFG